MREVKYLILGAGPAGLAFANRLRQRGCRDFLLVEQEKEVGGLCRTALIGDTPVDTGGGHFLDVRRPEVDAFLFGFLPESEWERFDRDSRIELAGAEVSHPLEANIWQLPVDRQVEYLISVAQAGCNRGEPMPNSFTDWIRWKLGDRIAEEYMLPYNRKMFGAQLDALGTYWLEKLPNVSFEQTLRSCLEHKPYGTQPGHAQFYYPKRGGYGALWQKLGQAVAQNTLCGQAVKTLDVPARTVTLADGSSIRAGTIVTTVPWPALELPGLPQKLAAGVAALRHTGVYVTYYPEHLETGAHWLYCPDPALAYHRILCLENFCAGKGYWTETNADRYTPGEGTAFYNAYAYPLNTVGKPAAMRALLDWARSHGVYGLGRWGEWEHYNSDAVVERALRLAEETEDAWKR